MVRCSAEPNSGLRRSRNTSGWRELNPRPLRPERSALPSCATARSNVGAYCFSELAPTELCPTGQGSADGFGLGLDCLSLSDLGRWGFAFEVVLSGEDRCGGAAQAETIERFDHPTVGLCFAGNPAVSITIEEEEHLHMRKPLGASFVAQVEASGDSAHGAALHIENDQFRREVADGRAEFATVMYAADAGAVAAQRCGHLIEEPISVGCQKYVWHREQASRVAGTIRC